jgi:hypothetical protein
MEDRMKSGRYSLSTETLRNTPMSNSKGLPRAVIIALVAIAAVALLSHNVGTAQGTVFTSTAPIRGYYLTKSTITGSKVLTACASGYHFASLWEILNTSDLHYNTALGRTNVNSGNGAPAISSRSTFADAAYGWIRTGAPDDPNCINWTSSNAVDAGTAGSLQILGGANPPQWIIDNSSSGQTAISCDGTAGGTPLTVGVWCVQN